MSAFFSILMLLVGGWQMKKGNVDEAMFFSNAAIVLAILATIQKEKNDG